MEDLELEIKRLIVQSLNLEGVAPESIDSDAPLFVEGLGLDSIGCAPARTRRRTRRSSPR